jgi:molybdopterin/thiamine biosynthesis adenylyltransferase
MRYTITFLEREYEAMCTHLFSDRQVERAGYILCRIGETLSETRLLAREFIPVSNEDIEESSATGMKINSRSFLRAMKKADLSRQLFVFVHSHPAGYVQHSPKDDLEETKLFATAYNRIKTRGFHASLVLSDPSKPVARVWLEDGTHHAVDLVRVVGKKFRFFSSSHQDPVPQFFDRQIRAFGPEIQQVLRSLHVGVVGVGGTGSAVTEQLTRLGIGKISIIDGETFEASNVNRVYGSSVKDEGAEKIQIAKRNIEHVALSTKVVDDDNPISFLSSVKKLKDCDIVFGCTDDHWGRSILCRMAVYYSIPVIDMGVRIHSANQIIHSVQGRATTLLPGNACLSCRGRITPRGIQADVLKATDPEQLANLIREGYADELGDPAPAVIPFTSTVASLAISELIHRLTGYMGEERSSNEIIIGFHESRLSTNYQVSDPDCFCGDDYCVMRGDAEPFLDLTWRIE